MKNPQYLYTQNSVDSIYSLYSQLSIIPIFHTSHIKIKVLSSW